SHAAARVPGCPSRTAAATCRAEGLTRARAPTTTVGTVSSPPVMTRTRAAAARSSQMLTHVADTRAPRSPSRSNAQYGHPGRQYTSTPPGPPAAGLTAAPLPGAAGRGSGRPGRGPPRRRFPLSAGNALDPHAAPERDMPGDCPGRGTGMRVIPGRVPVDLAVPGHVVVACLALPRAGARGRAGGEV